jgi:hypothetical protein
MVIRTKFAIFSLFRRQAARPIPRCRTIELGKRKLIIDKSILPGEDGNNINGPSLIVAPEWLARPLGRYYLYFAHHKGTYIRLATADSLDGPWRIHSSLQLSEVPACRGHIASPDVHIDPVARRVIMYFHGGTAEGKGQRTFVVHSSDGLHFEAHPKALGTPYFRVFKAQDAWFAMAKGGRLFWSSDGLTAFQMGQDAFPAIGKNAAYNRPGSVRHVAIDVIGQHADIYYTRIGDAPERILRSQMDLTGSWTEWRAGVPEEIARPEAEWEGVDIPVAPSKKGQAAEPSCALRDPYVFVDTGGDKYLLYSVAGEQGIAIAPLHRKD